MESFAREFTWTLTIEDEEALCGAEAVPESDADAAVATADVPPSSAAGSCGGGPSMAHLLVSYLLLMKLSTLCSGGEWPALRCASQ